MISKSARIALCASLMMGTSLISTGAMAQDDTAASEYAALLQQIEDTRMSIAQREILLETQKSQISRLEAQIEELARNRPEHGQ